MMIPSIRCMRETTPESLECTPTGGRDTKQTGCLGRQKMGWDGIRIVRPCSFVIAVDDDDDDVLSLGVRGDRRIL